MSQMAITTSAYSIYLVEVTFGKNFPLEEAQRDAQLCKNALEKEFPGDTFECGLVHGVLGVRFVAPNSSPNDPITTARRNFARGFMASSHLWER